MKVTSALLLLVLTASSGVLTASSGVLTASSGALAASGPDDDPVTVRGRVVDPEGLPVVGAQVELRRHAGGPAWNWGSIGVRTGREGHFECGVLEAGTITVIASGGGWAQSEPHAFVAEPGQVIDDLELSLRPGGRLIGEILRPDGAPDAGRTIRAQRAAHAERFGVGTTADELGFFELDHLEPGTWRIAAVPAELKGPSALAVPHALERVEMATVRIAAGETAHVVLGGPPAQPVRLRGRLVPGRWSFGDLSVAVLPEGAALLDAMELAPVRADGTFELALPGSGDYLILVTDPVSGQPYAELHRTISPEPDAPDRGGVQLLALPQGAIRGRVQGPDGKGLRGVPVVLESEGPPSIFDALGGRQTTTGTHGEFAFRVLPAGVYTARAGVGFEGAWNPTGHAVAVSPRVHLHAERPEAEVELVLAAPGTVTGSVRDATGAPVAGATVFLRDTAGRPLNPLSSCTTDPDGRFRYPHAPPGPVTVTARTESACSAESAPLAVRAGDSVDVSLVVDPGTRLRIAVTDATGRARRARVLVTDGLGRAVGALRPMADAAAELDLGFVTTIRSVGPLAPGRYRVIATNAAGRATDTWVELVGQPADRLVLTVE